MRSIDRAGQAVPVPAHEPQTHLRHDTKEATMQHGRADRAKWPDGPGIGGRAGELVLATAQGHEEVPASRFWSRPLSVAPSPVVPVVSFPASTSATAPLSAAPAVGAPPGCDASRPLPATIPGPLLDTRTAREAGARRAASGPPFGRSRRRSRRWARVPRPVVTVLLPAVVHDFTVAFDACCHPGILRDDLRPSGSTRSTGSGGGFEACRMAVQTSGQG